MRTMTLEQVRDRLRNDGSPEWCIPNAATCEQMADAIDALLRERESAKAWVTDEAVIRIARELEQAGWATGGDFEEDFLPDVRAALEAVAPMLANAPVPDAIKCQVGRGAYGEGFDEGWNACRAVMLAATREPEKE